MFKSLYISRSWFVVFAFCVILLILGFYLPVLMYIAQFSMIVFLIFTILDFVLLFGMKNPINATREIAETMNLGDETMIFINVKNNKNQVMRITVFDEPPVEMQARSLSFQALLKPKNKKKFSYPFRPLKRGIYKWKNIHVLISTFIGFLERKVILKIPQEASVFPSVLQMKNFEFLMFNPQTRQQGIKKNRRLGHHNEFEQIKNYVQGDDVRTINWKATSRTLELMVNQYQEQRSQYIYAVIDKSRAMSHTFEGLTLLDHAINSALVFSNIALRKGDKIGLFSFSNKIGSQIAANTGGKHLQRILKALYNQQTAFKEANYTLLYQAVHKKINSRSLLMLYTNFETELSMRRVLDVLKKLNKKHVLVVVFFENTDINSKLISKVTTIQDVYFSTLAEDVMNVKRRIALELKKNGIYTLLTTPKSLNVDTINKYIELKAKGVI